MSNIFIQGGVAAVTLFVLYVLGKEFFVYLNKRLELEKESCKQDSKNNNVAFANVVNSLNRLCEKMDKFIEAFNNNAIETAANQSNIKGSNDLKLTLLHEIKEKVDCIDERTKLLIPEKEGKV